MLTLHIETHEIILLKSFEDVCWSKVLKLHEQAGWALKYGDIHGFWEYMNEADLLEMS